MKTVNSNGELLQGLIFLRRREIEANPGYEMSILFKYGCYAESFEFASLVPTTQSLDKDGSPVGPKECGT